jgi:hypothetical protein
MEPEDWTGWMLYDVEAMTEHYKDLEDGYDDIEDCYIRAKITVIERLRRFKSMEGLCNKDQYYKSVKDCTIRFQLERTILWERGYIYNLGKWRKVASECRGILYDIKRMIEEEFALKYYEKHDWNDPPIPEFRKVQFLKLGNLSVSRISNLIVLDLVVGKIYCYVQRS